MGDRAGMAAMMMNMSVVQLEGIIGDRAMLEAIARERPLNAVLDENHIDYFVVSVYSPLERIDGAFRVMCPHPRQAGTRSKRMVGSFASPPLFTFEAAGVHSYVFRARSGA